MLRPVHPLFQVMSEQFRWIILDSTMLILYFVLYSVDKWHKSVMYGKRNQEPQRHGQKQKRKKGKAWMRSMIR